MTDAEILGSSRYVGATCPHKRERPMASAGHEDRSRIGGTETPAHCDGLDFSGILGARCGTSLRQHATQSVQKLRRSSLVEIVPATRQAWERAFAFYQARPDKSWSLVDCISILLCQDRRIQEVLTGDHHFEQAGLRILLRSLKKQ